MLKVGLVGLGFMGKMHFSCWQKLKNAKITGICDIDEKKLQGDLSSIRGNIEGGEDKIDLSGIYTTTNYEDFLKQDFDIIDITLPTFLHAEFTIKALEAGKNVLCEKPMALNTADCKRMIEARDKTGKICMIAHCLRFWPEYKVIFDIIKEKKYGEVISAKFTRLSPTPTWSWENWLLQPEKSGSCLLDLHIHDVDLVSFYFGKPKQVFAQITGKITKFDYVSALYIFEDKKCVNAEGCWINNTYPFRMGAHIVCEQATIVLDYTAEKSLIIYPEKGEKVYPELPEGDGYINEIKYFAECVEQNKHPEIVTLEEAMFAVNLVEKERESAEKNQLVAV